MHYFFFDSRGRNQALPHSFVSVRPGASIEQLLNNCNRFVKNNNVRKSSIYISGGICDILEKQKQCGYEETICSTTISIPTLVCQMQHFSEHMSSNFQNKVIYCTVPSMDISAWNSARLHQGKTTHLKYAHQYADMQNMIQDMCITLNNNITHINTQNRVVTPFLHKYVCNSVGKGKQRYYYNRLADGLHPTSHLTEQWTNHLSSVVVKNDNYS
jgi:hypothetical protein